MSSISKEVPFCIESSDKQEARGGVSPLDLFNGHLRTDDSLSAAIPLQLAFSPYLKHSVPIKGWYRRQDTAYQETPFVAKVQPFAAGGYEVTITKVDLEKVGCAIDGFCSSGKREKREQNINDIISARRRAVRSVRHKIKSMGADRLLTLSRREVDNYYTVSDWGQAWKRFCRLCRAAGIELNYVAVLETHVKGNYHMHAAIVGNINVKTIRRFWHISLGGRGNEKGALSPGNVDIAFKHNLTAHRRRAGVAKYVSKYITKQCHTDFNKKRYWSSRHKLPDVIRYELLPSETVRHAMFDLADILGLDVGELLKRIFVFKDVGAWFTFDDVLLHPVPF
jgi:hypothetical protein